MTSGNATLSSRLFEHTRPLHVAAERSGIVAALLRGRGTKHGYALLLRNLLPVYRALEGGLDLHRSSHSIGPEIARPQMYRSRALEADLQHISGADWAYGLPQLMTGTEYQHRVSEAATGDGSRLLAHAYVRYMGDLSGGQILKRLLAQSLKLPPQCLTFYDFPQIPDMTLFKEAFREALDRAPVSDGAPVVAEAAEAFRLNIALSEEIAGLDHSIAATGALIDPLC